MNGPQRPKNGRAGRCVRSACAFELFGKNNLDPDPTVFPGAFTMHSILAVDDSASMRQMLSVTLENAGHKVVEAVDGQDAWEKAHSHDFNLVLTDLYMPRLDGIALTRKLRESARFKTTPILILTIESSDEMKQQGRAAGATGWLVKPCDPAKLIEVIGKVIGQIPN
jgi:two-component system, chemotaxis family, chemotaxis protein CheY